MFDQTGAEFSPGEVIMLPVARWHHVTAGCLKEGDLYRDVSYGRRAEGVTSLDMEVGDVTYLTHGETEYVRVMVVGGAVREYPRTEWIYREVPGARHMRARAANRPDEVTALRAELQAAKNELARLQVEMV